MFTEFAIAGLAGVTRLTVYRHFPDEAALFGACSAHWLSRQQLPDPDAWSRIDDPAGRLRAGLADLYRFYRVDAGTLANVYRDFATLPEAQQQFLRDQDSRFRRVLAQPFPATPASADGCEHSSATRPRSGPGTPCASARASPTTRRSRP